MVDETINQHYSLVDNNLITNLCKNNSLKNLIKLSTSTDLYVFNKKHKKWNLKSKTTLLKECQNIRKKELKLSSSMLSNLAKLNSTKDILNVKNICNELQNKITNIDNIIDCIEHLELPTNNNLKISKTNNIQSFTEQLSAKPTQNINIIDINNVLNKQNTTENSDSFIECYTNC
jgi:hypothetical protein